MEEKRKQEKERQQKKEEAERERQRMREMKEYEQVSEMEENVRYSLSSEIQKVHRLYHFGFSVQTTVDNKQGFWIQPRRFLRALFDDV